jgi:predicted transposase YbfD/YdcC
VSAWATENRLVFGQVKTDGKSKGNEVSTITAIPTLLEKVALEGYIVTIDAMGCQYKIVNQIVQKKADYLFSLKGNQEHLHEDVADLWSENTLRGLISPRPGGSAEISIIGRRKQMAWSNECLEKLLFQSQLASEPG